MVASIQRISLICLLLITTCTVNAKTLALITTRSAGDSFWGPVESFMHAACKDLGMEFKVFYAEGRRDNMISAFQQAIKEKVDAVVFPNFQKSAYQLIKAAEEAKIPVFLFNSGISNDHANDVGMPRAKYKFWLGEMLPDDQGAGANLANTLVDMAKSAGKLGKDGKVHVIAISGHSADGAAIERNKGLKEAMKRGDAVLKQVVPANWDKDTATLKFTKLYERYPEASVAWAASDLMSIGIVDAIKKLGKTPGQDIFTGGVDLSKEGMEAVSQGTMSVTVGGHFMEGGWVAVMLYDYFNGIDFADEGLSMRSKMSVITKDAVQEYLKRFGKGNWESIDFKQFSKKHNSNLKKYNFGLDTVMAQSK
ncbi:ABC transporter substrate-binding protein [Zooshikella sp. RANM57]|uniref:ABC transporter substrate-binding protein n=1 Tax=Zooshikella sp. RANM57 TaxID=3425863 RepID=UPI003D6F2642